MVLQDSFFTKKVEKIEYMEKLVKPRVRPPKR